MKNAVFTAHTLKPLRDYDALRVLSLSIVIIALTLGAFYMLLLLRVVRIAYNSKMISTNTNGLYVVFGKKLINHRPDAEYRARLSCLVKNDFRSAILMGGYTGTADCSEAQAGLDYLTKHYHLRQPVYLEQHSCNTLENLKNSRQLINRQRITIISNRYHLARCSTLAQSLGIIHELCAAEPAFNWNLNNLFKCLQEAFYLHWFFCGKYWALMTRNQRMLNKIT